MASGRDILLTKNENKFWHREMQILDDLYKNRLKRWQALIDIYDLKFEDQIRDLRKQDLVKVSRFYPLVRQIIASIAFNYPKMFFEVDEDDTGQVADILERATSALFNLTDAKSHIHQAIFDALFCSVGWLRVDFNPPGDDMIPPYVTNDSMHEDLTVVSRCKPGWVHVDRLCPPNKLGHARYIRERMLVPLEYLKKDPNVKNKNQITPTSISRVEEFGFGEPSAADNEDWDDKALRETIENSDSVLVDRIHDRMNRKLIMFAEGVHDPIQEIDHPFMKMAFNQAIGFRPDGSMGPLMDEGGNPIFDLDSGRPAPGWLVVDGFPFIPVKFDLHSDSFYPLAHLEYVKDIQYGIVESLSRRANLLKRTARQGLMNESEALANPGLAGNLSKGVDGEWHTVQDTNNFKELVYGTIPQDQVNIAVDLKFYEEEITRVTELAKSAGTPRTATEASLIASQLSVNREWMEATVSKVYEQLARNFLQILGDPRYEPENFLVNVAPSGKSALVRAVRNSDFLWNYRIRVAAGSTQPLFEQIQQDKFLAFYDRAVQNPNFDQMELSKLLASSAELDIEKVIIKTANAEARQAAILENELMVTQLRDPGVHPEQDHKSHLESHQQYQDHPYYQQLLLLGQQVGFDQRPTNPQAFQQVQQIDAIEQGHMQQHELAMAQQVEGPAEGPQPAQAASEPTGFPTNSIQSTVRANAQRVSNTLQTEGQQATEGA